jgi:hypothetical protein
MGMSSDLIRKEEQKYKKNSPSLQSNTNEQSASQQAIVSIQ